MVKAAPSFALICYQYTISNQKGKGEMCIRDRVWRMGLSWVLCVQMGMGAVGVWYAMVVDWICRIICFVARFVSGAWKKNAVKQAA